MKRVLAFLMAFILMTSGFAAMAEEPSVVEVIMPAEYVAVLLAPEYAESEVITQEILDASVVEMGYESATLNEDGSAVFVMNEELHNTLVNDYKLSIEGVAAMWVGMEGSTIVGVKIDESGVNVEFALDAEAVGLMELMASAYVGVYVDVYRCIAGIDDTTSPVTFINQTTGEPIEAELTDIGEGAAAEG